MEKERYGECTPTKTINPAISFLGGLHLGMRRADVQRIWGKAGKVAGNISIYEIRPYTTGILY